MDNLLKRVFGSNIPKIILAILSIIEKLIDVLKKLQGWIY
jgi:hypothetical protein